MQQPHLNKFSPMNITLALSLILSQMQEIAATLPGYYRNKMEKLTREQLASALTNEENEEKEYATKTFT